MFTLCIILKDWFHCFVKIIMFLSHYYEWWMLFRLTIQGWKLGDDERIEILEITSSFNNLRIYCLALYFSSICIFQVIWIFAFGLIHSCTIGLSMKSIQSFCACDLWPWWVTVVTAMTVHRFLYCLVPSLYTLTTHSSGEKQSKLHYFAKCTFFSVISTPTSF